MGVEVFHTLKGVLKDRGLSTAVGDEGGFAPNLATNEDAIKLLVEAIEKAGYGVGDEIAIALDPAVSELYRDGNYHLPGEGKVLSSAELAAYWERLAGLYPIVGEDFPKMIGMDGQRSPALSARVSNWSVTMCS